MKIRCSPCLVVWGLAGGLLVLSLFVSLMRAPDSAPEGKEEQASPRGNSAPLAPILRRAFGFTEATPHLVPWDEIHEGCPRRDCIPALDEPRFVPADEAGFLGDGDAVLALALGGEAKAYPLKILNWHELVNDTVGKKPVLISYCPLCGSGVAFERRVEGKTAEFGVSGLLYRSDLVMYDRATNTLWSQIEGRAIAGPLSGKFLRTLPLAHTSWGEWKKHHPGTLVLSTDTGSASDYDRYPYGDYETNQEIFFPVAARDDRLPPKTAVYGVMVENTPIAYEAAWLREKGKLTDNVAGRELAVEVEEDGSVTVRDAGTGEAFTAMRLFWFAWYAFHPSTELRPEARPTAPAAPGP
ncbi:MAG: DUF3179 domain-containing protein [Acidobacteriota bacterium]|nr:MAG: DUF3179 domain-containing protein [Acidobacteriota bacterium]